MTFPSQIESRSMGPMWIGRATLNPSSSRVTDTSSSARIPLLRFTLSIDHIYWLYLLFTKKIMAYNETVGGKERHWCLTVFLIVILFTSFFNFFIGNSDQYGFLWRRAGYDWVLLLSCLSLVNFI